MAKCIDCVHKELCYMIEHYGREEDEDIECRRFKDKDEYIKVQHGMWIKEGNKRTCTRCGWIYQANGVDFKYCSDCGAIMV